MISKQVGKKKPVAQWKRYPCKVTTKKILASLLHWNSFVSATQESLPQFLRVTIEQLRKRTSELMKCLNRTSSQSGRASGNSFFLLWTLDNADHKPPTKGRLFLSHFLSTTHISASISVSFPSLSTLTFMHNLNVSWVTLVIEKNLSFFHKPFKCYLP